METCPNCKSSETYIGPGSGPHAAALRCRRCDRLYCWIPKAESPPPEELTRAAQERQQQRERERFPLFR